MIKDGDCREWKWMGKKRIRYLLEALAIAAAMAVLYAGWQLARGILLTGASQPAILDRYESVEPLQRHTSFGVSASFDAAAAAMCLGGLALFVFLYGLVRSKLARRNDGQHES